MRTSCKLQTVTLVMNTLICQFDKYITHTRQGKFNAWSFAMKLTFQFPQIVIKSHCLNAQRRQSIYKLRALKTRELTPSTNDQQLRAGLLSCTTIDLEYYICFKLVSEVVVLWTGSIPST